MKEYEKTHPWMKFSLDLRHLPYSTWVKLGECQSKCQHIAGIPLRDETANELYKIYLVKGPLASVAIEGNTLTEAEASKVLDGELKLPPSREYLGQEVENIRLACIQMVERIKKEEKFLLTVSQIQELNRLVLDKLTLEDNVIPGTIRTHDVVVATYKGAPPEDCEYLLERLCQWLSSSVSADRQDDFRPPKEGLEIAFAILKAIIAHLFLAWIHPFADGNGRTARLVEFQILLSSGIPAPACQLLSNHYNLTRTEYYRQLEHSSRSGGEVIPFISYAVQGLLDGLQEQLNWIWEQQWQVAWESLIQEAFQDKRKECDVRRRLVAIGVSIKGAWPIAKITEIGPQVAKLYAGKTPKTVTRDINELLKLRLIAKEGKNVRAAKERLRAFLPERVGL